MFKYLLVFLCFILQSIPVYRIVTANTNGAGTAIASSWGYWAAQIVSFK